jgi:hypothetical protein
MEDFVTRVETRVESAIENLQGVLTLLKNGEPIREPLTKIRRDLGSLEIEVIDNTR